jgi:hypothetical protein
LWRDRFHADLAIVGRAISINRHPFTVVGISPQSFAGIFGGVAEAAWIPLSGLRGLSTDFPPDPLIQLRYGLQVAVRLRPGVSDFHGTPGQASAAAELHALASYCAAAVLLLITVFFSGLVPARRAASVEPMQALRIE